MLMVRNMLSMRWKYQYFSKRSMEAELVRSVWAHLKSEKLS